jgi:hypothetical protein
MSVIYARYTDQTFKVRTISVINTPTHFCVGTSILLHILYYTKIALSIYLGTIDLTLGLHPHSGVNAFNKRQPSPLGLIDRERVLFVVLRITPSLAHLRNTTSGVPP